MGTSWGGVENGEGPSDTSIKLTLVGEINTREGERSGGSPTTRVTMRTARAEANGSGINMIVGRLGVWSKSAQSPPVPSAQHGQFHTGV